MTLYNKIGTNYSIHRKADSRIVEVAYSLLDSPNQGIIAEIGAGTGNYSNAIAEKGITVYAIEPSLKMVLQSIQHPRVKWIRGKAEQIPLSNNSVNEILIICALHHFHSLERAAIEFDRITKTGPIVILTFDPRQSEAFWLKDYFPSIWEDAFIVFDCIDSVANKIAINNWTYEIVPFLLPDDLKDRFMASCWKFPEKSFDKQLRDSMSAFTLADPISVENGIQKLKNDLITKLWDKKYGAIRNRNEIDLGYLFIKLTKN